MILAYSVCDSVGDVAASCLRRSNDLHDLALSYPKVACDLILTLDLGQLTFLGTVALQQFSLLVVRQNLVLRHEFVVRDVDQQLLLHEHLKVVRDVHRQVLNHIQNCGLGTPNVITYFAEELRWGTLANQDTVLQLIAERVIVCPLGPIVHVGNESHERLIPQLFLLRKRNKNGLHHLRLIAVIVQNFDAGAARNGSLHDHVESGKW